jgi:cytochrome b561
MVHAWKEGKRIGMTIGAMKRVIFGSVAFSIIPSIAILLTVLTLASALGLPLPWIRLSVIGAITYELPAAETAAQAFGTSIRNVIDDKIVFSAIAWAMSIGIILAPILTLIFNKKIQSGLQNARFKDAKWTTILISAMFLALISSFLGSALTGGLISVVTLIVSGLVMIGFGFLINKKGFKQLENFAMPVSMISGMLAAVCYNLIVNGAAV